MEVTACSLQTYCKCIPEVNQWKLDKQIDFEHYGVPTHLGAIADNIDEWEGRVAETLGLSTVDVSAIRAKHPDNLNLQTREALHRWQEKNGLGATYRNLIDVFLKAGKTSYAEAVCKVLGMNPNTENTSSTSVVAVTRPMDDVIMTNQSPTGSQGVAQKKSYDEEKKEFLKENMAKIKQSFGRLKRQVLRILKEKAIDMQEFITFVRDQVPPECIPLDAKEIFTIFAIMTQNLLWSYLEYRPLKSIAEEFAKEDTEELIDQYETKLASFFAATRLADYIDLCQDVEALADPEEPLALNPAKYNREYFEKLTIKLDRRVTNETLQYIDDLWKTVSKFFGLPPVLPLLDRVVAGSLVISWFIPRLFAMQIRANSTGGEARAFFRAHQITEVYIDNVCLYHLEAVVVATKLALLKACQEGNLDQVLGLVQIIEDFDFSQYHETPLTAAVQHADIIQVLLLHQIDVNGRNKDGVTALMVASWKGRTDVVEMLIKHNADVNAKPQSGPTALMMASKEGRIDVMKLLIQHNADMNASTEDGMTALMFASVDGRTDAVELLIQHNADVNASTKDGVTVLMMASKVGRTDVMELLMQHNADLNARTKVNATTVLILAILGGKTIDVVELFLKYNADVDARMENGGTALMVATQLGRTDVMELLIKHNADVNASTEDGWTAVMFASKVGKIDAMELLIQHNADVNASTEIGGTALMVASEAGRADAVELLLQHNAGINAKTKLGSTALMMAISKGRTDIVEILLKYNVDVNVTTENGGTALMLATLEGRTDVVELLIKHNANVNASTENGFTALAYATKNGELQLVKTLLEAGADPNIAENETNWTPLFYASKDGHEEIVQLLVEHGAEVDYKDKNGITAMDTARTYYHTEVIDLFMAFSMSMKTDVLSEEAHPPTHLSEETRQHVLSASNHNQKLFDRQKAFFKKITDFLLPERARKREATSKHTVSGVTEEDVAF